MQKFRLEGKSAIVTGGSKGIGFGIATALAEAGAGIALVARNQGDLERAQSTLRDLSSETVEIYPFDMSIVEDIPALFTQISTEMNGIDILVNNAGGTRRGPAELVAIEDWQFVITLNVTSVFVMSQAFARERIQRQGGGKIINIASIMSEVVREDNAPYAASKGAIRQLTKSLAIDWAKHKINVNGIGPGYIKTELTQPLWEDEEFSNRILEKTPLARWGDPDDIGSVAVFLASAASDFMTGQIVYPEGGILSRF
ncbi:gluconate 5-dehydrogenase [Candidatus Poribacteria bacterium]|nr:gluconate 5-dehydrogenase [Candidatus Poribacteria bacterium]